MMINEFTLDASVLIPLISENDIHSAPSKVFFDKVFGKDTLFIIHMLSLFETFHFLKRTGFLDDNVGVLRFRGFFNLNCFKYIDLNFHFFNLFKETNFFRNLKTSDAIVASTSIFMSTPLITWDKKMALNSLNAYTPTEFLDRFSD